MATWCFVSNEADQCCSPAVAASLFRCFTYSFGSICLGSLLQAVVSVLRFIVDNARSRRDSLERGDACGSFLFCVLDCMIQWLDEVVEYFNQWAYCFVAIYGLSYLDSGRKVVELFRARGWSTIVTDKLVGYATAFTSCSVGFVSGLMGMLIERQIQSNGDTDESFLFGDLPGPYAWAFV